MREPLSWQESVSISLILDIPKRFRRGSCLERQKIACYVGSRRHFESSLSLFFFGQVIIVVAFINV